MRAVAVEPGKANSIHLRDVPTPSLGAKIYSVLDSRIGSV